MVNSSAKNGRDLRRRTKGSSSNDFSSHLSDKSTKAKYMLPLSPLGLIVTLLFFLVVSLGIIGLEKMLPSPLFTIDAPQNPHRFIAERAMENLITLTSLGPRPTGSYENEVLAVKFFVKEIDTIIKNAKPVHKIELDIQKTSGAYPLTFLDGMTNVYRNVQNVIVKLGPQRSSNNSLLINCHFDTVPDSPGGSDDGASCAVMLELLRVVSQMDEPLKHNIVLLFNGAEENLMEASHGFITQHPWAKEIKAFVNLEACGAGGKEILFQAGPNHPWIMKIYSEVVPYPYASSLAQEIFQSGIIPGETDFRIFRDFGHVSGLDFAWATNGYVYHTKFDNVDQIPLGTLQRTGDNILALVVGIANCPELAETKKYSAGNLIYFDFLGIFMISWSENVNLIINVMSIGLSVFCITNSVKNAKLQGVHPSLYRKKLTWTVLLVLATWLCTLVAAVSIALFLTGIGKTMSWFACPAWIFFLYICPSLLLPMLVILLASRSLRQEISSPWITFQLFYDAYHIVWTVVLLMCTVMSIRSGFIALLWTTFASFGNLLQLAFFKHWKGWEWLVFHTGTIVLPYCQCLYLILGAMGLYVPIMGRIGAGNNGEAILSLITSAMFVLLFSFLIPLIVLTKKPAALLALFGGLFVGAIGVLIFTSLGFPYSGDPKAPAPQRYLLSHSQRVYHDIDGNVRFNSSGFWIVDLDVNSPTSVEDYVPEMSKAELMTGECQKELYCGLPYLMPVLTFIWKTHWIPAPPPYIPIPTTLRLASDKVTGDVRTMSFSITGPDHIGVMLSPGLGISLANWTLVDGKPLAGPRWNGRETYFIYYSCASDPEPWTFSINLKGAISSKPCLDIAVNGHFIHGPNQVTPKFKSFMNQFPSWTVTTGWVATYTSWKF